MRKRNLYFSECLSNDSIEVKNGKAELTLEKYKVDFDANLLK